MLEHMYSVLVSSLNSSHGIRMSSLPRTGIRNASEAAMRKTLGGSDNGNGDPGLFLCAKQRDLKAPEIFLLKFLPSWKEGQVSFLG